MYHIEDTVSALKEVQRLLGVNQTGAYDENTKKAVDKIQNAYGLSANSFVDYETFEAIVKDYKRKTEYTLKTDFLFDPVFPYRLYDVDDNVRSINDAIALISAEYSYEDVLPKGKIISQYSITAANFLRDIFNMKRSELIDEPLINRLILEKRAIEIKNKNG